MNIAAPHTDIIPDLGHATEELLASLSPLSSDKLNRVPFPGSWTAAQIGEHLLKSYSVTETLAGTTGPAKRPIDEKVETIRNIFLDFSTKMESPEFILPSTGTIDKDQLLSELYKKTDFLISFGWENDLAPLCLDFELPVLGHLTRLEWLHFVSTHTQRHNHQLKHIIDYLDKHEK